MHKLLKITALSLAFLLAGCSYEPGYTNPFKDDNYEKIGLNSEFNVVRSATAEELFIFESTLNDDLPFPINSSSSKIEARDYSLSRTGVFKNGYDAFDSKLSVSNEVKLYNNNVCHSNLSSNLIKHYEYANENTIDNIDSYLFTSDEHDLLNFYDVLKVTNHVANNSKPVVTSEKVDKYNPSINKFSDLIEELDQTLLISELGKPIGVDSESSLIFAKEDNAPYKTEGLFINKSGEKFRAMANTFVVAKMTRKTIENEDFYILSYYRRYTETIITSKALQPNARIEYLENPIIINYLESVTSMDVDETLINTSFNKANIPTIDNGGNNNA